MVIFGVRISIQRKKVFYAKNFRSDLNCYRTMRLMYHIPVAVVILIDMISTINAVGLSQIGVIGNDVIFLLIHIWFGLNDLYFKNANLSVMEWMDNRMDLSESDCNFIGSGSFYDMGKMKIDMKKFGCQDNFNSDQSTVDGGQSRLSIGLSSSDNFYGDS